MERKNAWSQYSAEELSRLEAVNEDYKACLDAGKTERECVRLTIERIEKETAPLCSGARDNIRYNFHYKNGQTDEPHKHLAGNEKFTKKSWSGRNKNFPT